MPVDVSTTPTVTVTPAIAAVNVSQCSLLPGGRLISVLESTEAYNVKHPLQHGWSLWLKKADAKPDGGKPQQQQANESSMEVWKRQVEHIGDICTVEDFWWYTFTQLSAFIYC